MYKVIINDQEILVSQEDIDNLDVSYDKRKGVFQVLKGGISYQITPLSESTNSKTQQLQVNHLNLDLKILNPLDQQVDSMGLSNLDEHKSKDIIAPMPGLILDIMCKEGDEINEGDSLLILEAMKMENVIKAEGSGTISKINKSVGDSVEKGKIIIEIV